MSNVEIVNESLETILKNGDLYDAIALKEGASPQKNMTVKNHILLFSRILYIGVLIYDKIQSKLSPVEKIKNAQDQIRNILGVNIDIIKSKRAFDLNNVNILKKSIKGSYLSVLYEKSSDKKEDYLEDLKKISTFCELYNINEILLKESDVINLYTFIKDAEFNTVKFKNILNFSGDGGDKIDCKIISLNQTKLRDLIKKLEVVKLDKNFIVDLSKDVEDITIKNAINSFIQNGDIEKLKSILNQRLSLIINSDNTYIDKGFGKVYENVTIKEEFIKVMASNGKGETVNNTVSSLFDYLGVLDYKDLINKTKMKSDNKEIMLVSAIYLYLCNNTKTYIQSENDGVSFYDKIYDSYKAKLRGEIKKIPGLYDRENKSSKISSSFILTYITAGFFLITAALTGITLEGIQNMLIKNNDQDMIEIVIDKFFYPYIYSFNIEKDLVESVLDGIDDMDIITTGDSLNNSEKTVGTLIPIKNCDNYPRYFANGFADEATYKRGEVTYNIIHNLIDSTQYQDVEVVFEIMMDISRHDLRELIKDHEINFEQSLYPVGDNYVLSNIQIMDTVTDAPDFNIDGFRASNWGNKITSFEEEALLSMRQPIIIYEYGISKDKENSFVEQIDNYDISYSDLPSEDIKEAITSGLGLSEDATIERIFTAIMSKDYSKTPIKDAGLTTKIKKMDEKEYYECAASLDSLVCNMAATLAVETDQELVYTVGYLDNGDGDIVKKEAHGWAMNAEGDIIDITPSNGIKEEENDLSKAISNIATWGQKNSLSVYIISLLIAWIGYKLFGKKIKFTIKVNAIEKVLTDPDVDVSYAKLKETLYGGINIPFERSPIELVDAVCKELSAYTIDELKEIRKELVLSDFNNDSALYNNATKLIDSIPYIRENEEAIKLALQKRSQ